VKRDNCQPATRHQQLFRRYKPAIELTKLVIDGDAKGLERPSRWVLARFGLWHSSTHYVGELERTSNGPAAFPRNDRTGNAAGEPLLAEVADELAQLLLR